MSLPELPVLDKTFADALGEVIRSIAEEEKALGHLLESETKELQLAADYITRSNGDAQQLANVNESAAALLEQINEMQIILKNKLRLAVGYLPPCEAVPCPPPMLPEPYEPAPCPQPFLCDEPPCHTCTPPPCMCGEPPCHTCPPPPCTCGEPPCHTCPPPPCACGEPPVYTCPPPPCACGEPPCHTCPPPPNSGPPPDQGDKTPCPWCSQPMPRGTMPRLPPMPKPPAGSGLSGALQGLGGAFPNLGGMPFPGFDRPMLPDLGRLLLQRFGGLAFPQLFGSRKPCQCGQCRRRHGKTRGRR